MIATLVSNLRTLGPPKNESQAALELRRQYISRILKFTRDVENTAGNRAQVLIILDQIESEGLLPVNVAPLLLDTFMPVRDRPIPHGLATLAAAWSCLPYLQAKCDASPYILQDKRKSASTWFSKDLTPVSLLEASVLGGLNPDDSTESGALRRFKASRGYTEWHVSQRLDTVRFLLNRRVKAGRGCKRLVKKRIAAREVVKFDIHNDSRETQYWTLVAWMLDNRSNLASLNTLKRSCLPGVEEAWRAEEFANFEILLPPWLFEEIDHGAIRLLA